MMTRDNYISLGMIVKTRGISGDLVIRSKKKILQLKSNCKTIWIEIDGLLVPFFISSYTFLKDNEILIGFEDIDLPEKAAKLKGRNAFVHKSDAVLPSIDDIPEHILGYMIIDIHSGEIGKITGIEEIPENSLFRVEYGHREILIPIQEGIICEINEKKRFIRVNLPGGFLEI